MITKSERYREILPVFTRHGIGVADDQIIQHQAGDQACAREFYSAGIQRCGL